MKNIKKIPTTESVMSDHTGAVPTLLLLSNSVVGCHKMKTCSKCKKEKAYEEFSNDKRTNDGYQGWCKECCYSNGERYRKSRDGVAKTSWHHQHEHSRKRGHNPPNYTYEEYKNWMLNHEKFEELYEAWVKSDYNLWLKPSCDRKDDYKTYTLDNIQLTTWYENNRRAHKDRYNGLNNKSNLAVYQYDLEGNYLNEYYSASKAARDNGGSPGKVQAACRGEQLTSGGFIWRYKKDCANKDNLNIYKQ